MDFMNVFCAPAAQQAAHPFGGTLINLLVQQLFFRPIDLLRIQEILKQQKDFKTYLIPLVFIDATE